MKNELYQSLDELVRKNEALTIKLELANIEISKLKMQMKELKDGKISQIVNSQDANNEIGRVNNPIQQRSGASRRSFKHPFGRRDVDLSANMQ
jgi:hypothetical protein